MMVVVIIGYAVLWGIIMGLLWYVSQLLADSFDD